MLTALLLAGALATTAIAPAAPPVPATPTFRSYGVAAGLPSADVYGVTQDHTGYLWIGTHAGLVRYDGSTFHVFRHDPGQPASLPADDVSALLVDRAGQLWVGGEGTGLNRYQPGSQGFQHWLHRANDSASLSANDVMAIAQDSAGVIWVGVYAGGLNQLNPDGRASRIFATAPATPPALRPTTWCHWHPPAMAACGSAPTRALTTWMHTAASA